MTSFDLLVRTERGQSAHRRRDRHGVPRHAEAPRQERGTPRVHGECAGAGRRLDDARGRPLRAARSPLPALRPAQGRARVGDIDPRRACASSSRYKGTKEFVLTFNLNNGIEYWQIEESNWTDAPLLAEADGDVRLPSTARTRSSRAAAQIQTIAVFHGGARLLGAEHDPQQPVERDDDRDRRGSSAATTERPVTVDAVARIANLRSRLRRPRHRCVLRRPRPRRRPPRRRARARSSACARARCRSTSPASRTCIARNARAASRSRSTCDEAVDGAEFLYVAVGTPPTYARRRRPRRRSGRSSTSCPTTCRDVRSSS